MTRVQEGNSAVMSNSLWNKIWFNYKAVELIDNDNLMYFKPS